MNGNYIFGFIELCYLPATCLQCYIKSFRQGFTCNGSFSTVGKKFIIKLKVYRELQLLAQYFNDIHNDTILPAFLFITTFLFISCAYALAFAGFAMPAVKMGEFSWLAFCCWLAIAAGVGTFGRVNGESKEALSLIYRKVRLFPQVRRCDRQQLIKFMLSLQPLKIKVGYVNFVEKFTPIILLHFCVSQIVSLLLIH